MTTSNLVLLFISVLASGLVFFTIRKTNAYYLKLALAFTGSYLFSISLLHLLPGVFASAGTEAGYYILGGFFLQLILEYLTGGIEHGHIHKHHDHLHAFPLTMMIGLCVHSFLEGIPLAGGFDDHHHGKQLLTGIILHHLPVSFALASMLAGSGVSKSRTVFYLILFAGMSPAGALAGNQLSEMSGAELNVYFDRIMAVVIGIFLHISTTILFETSSEHKFNLYKLGVIVLGAAAVILI